MTPKKVRDEWRRAFVQDAAVTARLCDDLDTLEAEVAKQEARIVELERERDEFMTLAWSLICRPELDGVLVGEVRERANGLMAAVEKYRAGVQPTGT